MSGHVPQSSGRNSYSGMGLPSGRVKSKLIQQAVEMTFTWVQVRPP